MEEKKFDINSLIGFVLIGLILIWILYKNTPSPGEQQAEATKTEQQDTQDTPEDVAVEQESVGTEPEQGRALKNDEEVGRRAVSDSLRREQLKSELGSFAYAATLPSATEAVTTLENDRIRLKISNKGGHIAEATLKEYHTYDDQPLYLIRDGNASLNLQFEAENRQLHTKDLYFEPTLSRSGDSQVLSMKLRAGPDSYLEYRYELKPDAYMTGFAIRTRGLSGIINTARPAVMEWDFKTYRKDKSVSYENRYTEILWEYDGDDDYLGQGRNKEKDIDNASYIAAKQHFFSTILLTDTPFRQSRLTSENLVRDETVDTVFTKRFTATMPLEFKAGELSYTMNWYHGPTDYKTLKSYDRNLEAIVSMGWGIIGWINKYAIMPLFNWLGGFMSSYGIVIIVLTIIVKIALSPVQYKQYLSQMKMKVLKPEIEEINKKYKDNAMKRQQETMKLYTKAGANPMAGCVPALAQMPVFIALFMFFPSAFVLRQKGFLWANDLSSYDNIASLPFNIPFYGDHISLFPILASVAILIYMLMTTGQSIQPSQPGMPNMKFIIYLSPLIMLVFFNNYASGLALYFFISNLITIGIMLVIKNFILDEVKIHAKVEEQKKKPRKKGRFRQKLADMMEQAEKQRQLQEKRKKRG